MAAKIIMFEQQARDKILKGVNIMADAVKSTLGPERSQRDSGEILGRAQRHQRRRYRSKRN